MQVGEQSDRRWLELERHQPQHHRPPYDGHTPWKPCDVLVPYPLAASASVTAISACAYRFGLVMERATVAAWVAIAAACSCWPACRPPSPRCLRLLLRVGDRGPRSRLGPPPRSLVLAGRRGPVPRQGRRRSCSASTPVTRVQDQSSCRADRRHDPPEPVAPAPMVRPWRPRHWAPIRPERVCATNLRP